jgi:hypothetical protein
MRNPGGYAFSFTEFGVQKEMDTFTCFHCNTVVHIKPKCSPDDLGGMCRLCMKMICPKCVDLPCVPFEKKLDALEKRDRALRSYGV